MHLQSTVLGRGGNNLRGFPDGLMEQSVDDGGGGAGAAVSERFFAHGGKLSGLVEEAVDLVGERGEFVALEGDAFFEQVVAVAVLLAGDGRDDDHGQAGGERIPRW